MAVLFPPPVGIRDLLAMLAGRLEGGAPFRHLVVDGAAAELRSVAGSVEKLRAACKAIGVRLDVEAATATWSPVGREGGCVRRAGASQATRAGPSRCIVSFGSCASAPWQRDSYMGCARRDCSTAAKSSSLSTRDDLVS